MSSDPVFERSASVLQRHLREVMSRRLSFAGVSSGLHRQHPSVAAPLGGRICSPPAGARVSMPGPQQDREGAACSGSCQPGRVPPLAVQRFKGNQALHGVLQLLLPMAGLEANGGPKTLAKKR